MKLKRLLAVLLCTCLVSGCAAALAISVAENRAMEISMKDNAVIFNGQKIEAGQQATLENDGNPLINPLNEGIRAFLEKILGSEFVVSFVGSDGQLHYQPGTNNSFFENAMASFEGNLVISDGGNSAVALNDPADVKMSGSFGAVLVGPEAEGSTVTLSNGSIGTLLVGASGVTINNGGKIENLIPSDDTVVNTLHRHTPGEQKKVNEIPATTTSGGQYTLITYCGDPTCGQQIDIVTVKTDPLPPPSEPDPEPEKEQAPAPAAEPEAEHPIDEEPGEPCTAKGLQHEKSMLLQENYEEDGKAGQLWGCDVCHWAFFVPYDD